MAYDIGPRIGIEGEAEFRKAVGQINTTLKTLGTEMAVVTSAYAKGDRSAAALTAQNEVLNKQIATQREKLEELKKGLAAATEKYGENDRVTQGWQQAVNKATADLNNMERQLEENNRELRQGSESGDKFRRVMEGVGSVISGVVVAATAAAAAVGAVAAATGAAAIKLGKEVVQQFGELEQNLGGSEAVFGEYAASIQKIGEEAYKNLGASQSQYLATANKMGALFQGSGIEQQKSLELTTKAMQRAADMASVMGIDVQVALDSVAGAAKGNFTMMDNLGVAMNATTIQAYAAAKGFDFVWSKASQAEKVEMAMRMFFENTEQYAGNFAREASETVTGSLGMMEAAFNSFIAGLGNKDADIENLTQNLVDSFQSVVDNVVPVIRSLVAALPPALQTLLSGLGDLLPTLLETATSLFEQVLNTLLTMLPALIPVAVQAVGTIVNAVAENLPLLVSAATQLITTLANGLMKTLPKLVPVAIDAVMTIVDAILDNLPTLLDTALQVILALVSGLTQALPELIPAAVDTILTLVETLIDNLPLIIDVALDIILALVDGVIKALPKIVKAAPRIITSLVNGIVQAIPKLLDAALEIITALIEFLPEYFPMLIDAMPEVLSAIVTGLIQSVGKIWEFIPVMYKTVIDAIKSQDWAQMGKDIIDGLVKGVKNAAAKVGTALKEVANGAINSVKKVLGIRSPSKVFADIGENMGLGLEEGFVGIMGQVSRSIANAVPKSIDAPLIRTAASMHTITQPLASVSAPTTVQLIANERVLGEVVLPTVSRGLATQRMNLALARGAV